MCFHELGQYLLPHVMILKEDILKSEGLFLILSKASPAALADENENEDGFNVAPYGNRTCSKASKIS